MTMSSSQQSNPNMFPSSASRMQEEIKRLQQLQRLRAATAACNFPNASGGSGGLMPSNNTNEFAGLSSMPNMMGNNNMIPNSPANNGPSLCNNPALASFLAAQQQQQQEQEETRLMLLQHQLRNRNVNMNNGHNNSTSAPMSSLTNPLPPYASSRAMAANMFSDNTAPSASSTALSQQQFQLQQQMSPQGISGQILANRGPLMRVGAIEPFPEKLHRMLMEVEQCGRGDVISFINNGRGFAIHKPDTFFKEIVPLYFRHSRLSSFKRQLNLYGFEQINIGPYRGGYYHEMFHRDTPEVCRRMRRVAVKVSGATAQKKKEEAAKAKAEKEGQGSKDEQQHE